MLAKTRIALAILSIAFLLFSPVANCAGTVGMESPSHPCCPKTPAPQQNGAKFGCVCFDRQPALPSLPALRDQGQVEAAASAPLAFDAAEMAGPEFHDFVNLVPPSLERFLSFHQLLL
ncbi:MAG TPA: hypothetical protein VGH38_19660 [Bryobacteraceae bacterium]